MLKYFSLFVVLVLIIIGLDQYTKNFFISFLKTQPNLSKEFLEILDFVYIWNFGISLGLFNEYRQYSNYIFTVLNLILILFLIFNAFKIDKKIDFIAFSFIIGGSLSNIIDRIIRGAVFDFIYLHYNQYDFAVFNIADFFVTLGVLILLFNALGSRN